MDEDDCEKQEEPKDQFNDVGLEPDDADYFVDNPNDMSYTDCETGREIFTQEMLDDTEMGLQAEMLPQAMRPSEFGHLADQHTYTQGGKFSETEVAE